MTAEKLDEADALQGQYGKSESINQSINQSRRDLSNDMTEYRPILKHNQIRNTPVLISHPKQVQHSSKRGFVLLC